MAEGSNSKGKKVAKFSDNSKILLESCRAKDNKDKVSIMSNLRWKYQKQKPTVLARLSGKRTTQPPQREGRQNRPYFHRNQELTG